MKKPKLLFKKGQLVVVTASHSGCSCAFVKEGALIQLGEDVDEDDSDNYVVFMRYPEGSTNGNNIPTYKIRALAPGKERLKAKAVFKKATSYNHATVIGI